VEALAEVSEKASLGQVVDEIGQMIERLMEQEAESETLLKVWADEASLEMHKQMKVRKATRAYQGRNNQDTPPDAMLFDQKE
jgi:hypothetical protein